MHMACIWLMASAGGMHYVIWVRFRVECSLDRDSENRMNRLSPFDPL